MLRGHGTLGLDGDVGQDKPDACHTNVLQIAHRLLKSSELEQRVHAPSMPALRPRKLQVALSRKTTHLSICSSNINFSLPNASQKYLSEERSNSERNTCVQSTEDRSFQTIEPATVSSAKVRSHARGNDSDSISRKNPICRLTRFLHW